MDWTAALAPLVLVALVSLFAFVGCSIDQTGLAPDQPDASTQPKDVLFVWTSTETQIQGIALTCTVQGLDAKGQATGDAFPGAGVSPAAWPGSYMSPSGQAVFSANVELPPVAQYVISATANVTVGAWNGSSSTLFTSAKTSPIPGGASWESQPWGFSLSHDATGWVLTPMP